MTITAEKTWEVFPAILYGEDYSAANECKASLHAIKEALLDGTVPWVVRGSSDGATYGMDNTDRWTDYSKIVAVAAAGTAHSWIVLEIPELHATDNVQICIDMVGGTGGNYLNMYLSPAAGFTGGSLTDRPTATDEGTAVFTGVWIYSTDSVSRTVYVCKSADGHCTRVYLSHNKILGTVWMFDRIKNAHADIARPYYLFVKYASNAEVLTWANFVAASFNSRIDAVGTNVAMNGTTYVISTTSPLRDASHGYGEDFAGFNIAMPLGLFWAKTNPPVDHMDAGMIYDLWLLGTNGVAFDYLKDAGGAWKMIRVGDGFAQPGDGATEWWRIG